MEKSNHRYNGSIIPYEELTNFIEPIKINIEIPHNYLPELCAGVASEILPYVRHIFDDGFNRHMPLLRDYLGRNKYHIASLSYVSHVDGYDFRVNPINIFNNIFEYLGFENRIPNDINLDTDTGMNYLKDYIRHNLLDVKRQTTDDRLKDVLDELNQNLDSICSTYYRVRDISEFIVPKTALFYLAYTSLDLYEQTGEVKYLLFANEYYQHVGHMRTSEYPHKIALPTRGNRIWFGDFNQEFADNITEDMIPNIKDYLLTNNEVYLAWDILSPGMVDRALRDVAQRARAESNVDYDKFNRLFEMKMNYYMNSGFNKNIIGKYGLTGYVGFTYPNEYLLFDKFHNSDTKDYSKRTVLTHGEAVYALPSDKFEILRGDKQSVLRERQMDDRIKKVNHTDNFTNRVDPIIHGPNVSTSTFDTEVERLKKRMLIK